MIAAKQNVQSWTIIDLEKNQVIPCVNLVLEITNLGPTKYRGMNNQLTMKEEIIANISINPKIEPDVKWVMSWINECFSNSLSFSKKRALAIWCDSPIVLYGCYIKNYTNSDSNFFSTIDIEISCDFYERGIENEIFKQFKRDDSLNKILGIGF